MCGGEGESESSVMMTFPAGEHRAANKHTISVY